MEKLRHREPKSPGSGRGKPSSRGRPCELRGTWWLLRSPPGTRLQPQQLSRLQSCSRLQPPKLGQRAAPTAWTSCTNGVSHRLGMKPLS